MKTWLIATFWLLKLQLLRKKRRLLLLRRRYQLRTRHYLTRECLQPVNDCAWSHLYNYGSDLSFLHVTSLTRAAFGKLHAQFRLFYMRPKCGRGGRPEKVTSIQALGCILQYYTDRMDLKSLSLLHGLPPATLSRTLNRAEVALLQALKTLKDAEIRWPTKDEQRLWVKLVERKNPLVTGRWGFIDGKNY